MSELIKSQSRGESFRRGLFTNTSILALLGFAWISPNTGAAQTEDGRPTVWIELGGQLEKLDSPHEVFTPLFLDETPSADATPMVAAQRPSRYSVGGEGKISFAPRDTDWVLSAGVRYGRSDNARHLHQQTLVPYVKRYLGYQVFAQPGNQIFGDGQTNFKESHFVLDFQAGKDVGLGFLGGSGTGVFSAGVRYAQFTSSSDVSLHARPEYRFGAAHSGTRQIYRSTPTPHFVNVGYRTVDHFRHTYTATLHTARNTHAVGPSVSWDASLAVAGSNSGATLAVDWGANGAILFGRQRSRTHHQTTGHYYSKSGGNFKYHTTPDGASVRGASLREGGYVHGPVNRTSSRMVTIPNVGGFAAISLKFPNAKVSLGYRADFFFNATDNGIDTRNEINKNFFGPYATISIGLGG